MAQKYNPGDTAFIVESARFIREGTVIRKIGSLYVFGFSDCNGGVKVREDRLYPSQKEAESSLYKNRYVKYRSPWV